MLNFLLTKLCWTFFKWCTTSLSWFTLASCLFFLFFFLCSNILLFLLFSSSLCFLTGVTSTVAGDLVAIQKDAKQVKHALQGYLQDKLAPYKQPREYIFVEAIPRNHMGKVRITLLTWYVIKWFVKALSCLFPRLSYAHTRDSVCLHSHLNLSIRWTRRVCARTLVWFKQTI